MLNLSGIVSTYNEDESERYAKAADGKVPWRRGAGLRWSGARVAILAEPRDAEPPVWTVPVFTRGQLHTADQP